MTCVPQRWISTLLWIAWRFKVTFAHTCKIWKNILRYLIFALVKTMLWNNILQYKETKRPKKLVCRYTFGSVQFHLPEDSALLLAFSILAQKNIVIHWPLENKKYLFWKENALLSQLLTILNGEIIWFRSFTIAWLHRYSVWSAGIYHTTDRLAITSLCHFKIRPWTQSSPHVVVITFLINFVTRSVYTTPTLVATTIVFSPHFPFTAGHFVY